MFNPSPETVRRFFCETSRKCDAGEPLTPIEAMAADWIALHPEYRDDLASVDLAIAARYPADADRDNPFLHLSLHLAVAEQVSIDQPPGIAAASRVLATRLGSPHAAAHALIDCLRETLARAARESRPLDGEVYLACVRRRVDG